MLVGMRDEQTMIRIGRKVRDHAKALSRAGDTYSDVIEEALQLLERERFWEQVGSIVPDAEYQAEFNSWDGADLD
jgi:urease gamma subunit